MNGGGRITSANYFKRVVRAAKLDATLYEEVETDKSSLGQALGMVVLSSVAAGVGTLGLAGGIQTVLSGTFLAVTGWLFWAFLTYWIGTRLLPEPQTRADWGELLRTTGFSSAPGLIRVFGLFPGLTEIVFLIAGVWMLAAMVVAVRQALDYQSTGRAIGVCIIGWPLHAVVLFALLFLFG
ncbi:MAG TPA: YIP1 family protein [Candidatus Manganitrophaceae bacterium]|nr:YIP1 family protein [Candidatus Manganitrophaceae bacterium]